MIKSRKLGLIAPLLLLTLAALACGLPGSEEISAVDSELPTTAPPTAAPADTQPEALPTGDSKDSEKPDQPLPYFEDFSDPTGIWGNGAQGTGEYEYIDGTYEVRVLPEHQFYYVLAEETYIRASDVIIEADVWKAAGDDETSAGVVCRANEDTHSFYAFEVVFDGWAGILKAVDGEFVVEDMYVQTDVVLQGTAMNHIRAECIGSDLRLYVNGQLVVEFQDDELTFGDVGIASATWPGKPNSAVRFDNLSVSMP